MAVVRCSNCEKYVDDDWNPMEVHPLARFHKWAENELVCENCYQEIKADLDEGIAREEV